MKKECVFLLGALGIMLSSCSIPQEKGIYYEDEDFIVQQGDSYSYLTCLGNLSDLEIRGYSGTQTIFAYNGVSTLETSVSYQINMGKIKVVLIDPNNEITELNGEQIFSLSGGLYRIKIIGDNAYGNLSINIV